MSVTIYGHDLPVAVDGASLPDVSVSSSERAADHTTLASVSAEFTALDLQTVPLQADIAAAWRGFLKSRGDRWAFDLAATTVDDGLDTYSAKGLAATAGVLVGARGEESVVSSSPDMVGEYTVPYHGDACVEVQAASTNLFAANVRTGTDTSSNTTGFTAIDSATLASSTAQKRFGSRSLKVTTLANGNGTKGGVYASAACAGSTRYTGSVYLRAASGTPQVEFALVDDGGGVGTAVVVDVPSTGWLRVEGYIDTSAGAANASLRIRENTADSAIEWYADGWQLETGAWATTWVDGTRAAAQLSYRLLEQRRGDDLTVAGWFLAHSDADGYLWTVGTATERISARRSSGDLVVEVVSDGTTTTATVADAFLDPYLKVWRHVAVTLRRNPTSGEQVTVYVDGAEAATSLPEDLVPVLSRPTLWVGTSAAGTSHWCGLIDELWSFPWAMPATMVAALYNRALTAWPDLLVGGRLVGADYASSWVSMTGAVTGDRLAPVMIDGVWNAAARSLAVTLTPTGTE